QEHHVKRSVRSAKTITILVLTLTTVGGAILAWQQYQELVELRAAAMNKDERVAMQKRIWDLERYNKELNDQLTALRDAENAGAPAVAGGPGGPAGGGPGGGAGVNRGGGGKKPLQRA